MKIKKTTKDRYWKFKETAKKSAKFTTNGVQYTQDQFEELIGVKSPIKTPVEDIAINIIEDIKDESYGDLETEEPTGDTEES